jgi:Capsule assembly protein Wzi
VKIRARSIWMLALLVSCVAGLANADPWLEPGDEGLRSDIQLLADAGILRGPMTTWPLSWPDIARDAQSADESALDIVTAAALVRVRRLSRDASSNGFAGLGIRARGTNQPVTLRGFADTPRDDAELSLRASWLTDHISLKLQGTVVAEPDDDQQFRADGSYIGVNVGNFMISAGFMERWWGPGWDGSLILSTNARPIPSITLERNYTDPFKSKWLSWIGPWRASIAVGEMEGHDVAVPDVKFLAARVNFRPRRWLEFGLTRTAQFCGGDRTCDWGTFTDMLFGRDNTNADDNPNEEPGNQLAGYDMRLSSPWKALPMAFYTQWIGEDEAGGMPSRFIGQFGLEFWGDSVLGGYRLRTEYSDTACTFTKENPDFNLAYRHHLYPQGYAYRGRIIGHSMDNDSRMFSVAGLLTRTNGDVLTVELRQVKLNRDGTGTHAISEAPADLDNVELRYSKIFGIGKVSLGLGYDDMSTPVESSSEIRAFLGWQQGF